MCFKREKKERRIGNKIMNDHTYKSLRQESVCFFYEPIFIIVVSHATNIPPLLPWKEKKDGQKEAIAIIYRKKIQIKVTKKKF